MNDRSNTRREVVTRAFFLQAGAGLQGKRRAANDAPWHVGGRLATDNGSGRPSSSTHLTLHHQKKRGVAIWSKFDDNYDYNPKILAAGRDGKNLHEASIRWNWRVLARGIIPKNALAVLGIAAQLPPRLHRSAVAALVRENLWEDYGNYWVLHDWFDYAPPARYLPADFLPTKNRQDADDFPSANRRQTDTPDQTRPDQTRPGVSLEHLQAKAIGRGVAPETVSERLAGLQQLAEEKGAKHWIPYVLTGFRGQACLFDQAVSRWLEEDHRGMKERERNAESRLGSGLLKRIS